MNWMSILKEESMWMTRLPEDKKKLLSMQPSFDVEFPELKHPSDESEISQVIEAVRNSDLTEEEETDYDKNNIDVMLEIVDEDKDNWAKFVQDVDIYTIKLKMKYGRKRPYEFSDKIESKTDTDDSPSFPSGHAIEAYALAKVLGEKHPDKEKELNDMAQNVAMSRLQMGNHYPSDIKAGKKVGLMIADAYLSTNKIEKWSDILSKKGDGFKREKESGLHGWFSRRGGKETKGGKTQGGWIDCSSCGSKNGPKPCGRKDASKGTKRRCRPTCSACKTYKRRRGTR